jgi:hypothetical protein
VRWTHYTFPAPARRAAQRRDAQPWFSAQDRQRLLQLATRVAMAIPDARQAGSSPYAAVGPAALGVVRALRMVLVYIPARPMLANALARAEEGTSSAVVAERDG